jgi:hypothetical protein
VAFGVSGGAGFVQGAHERAGLLLALRAGWAPGQHWALYGTYDTLLVGVEDAEPNTSGVHTEWRNREAFGAAAQYWVMPEFWGRAGFGLIRVDASQSTVAPGVATVHENLREYGPEGNIAIGADIVRSGGPSTLEFFFTAMGARYADTFVGEIGAALSYSYYR